MRASKSEQSAKDFCKKNEVLKAKSVDTFNASEQERAECEEKLTTYSPAGSEADELSAGDSAGEDVLSDEVLEADVLLGVWAAELEVV